MERICIWLIIAEDYKENINVEIDVEENHESKSFSESEDILVEIHSDEEP